MSFNEWQIRLAESINKQKGQNYPCSNQTVVNGFFGRKFLWDNFIKENKNNIIEYYKNSIRLNNGEKWYYFKSSIRVRGYRFYKIKIDATLPKEIVMTEILPLCSFYCKELTWLK